MFWPSLNYTLGALGHCTQHPLIFLCCCFITSSSIQGNPDCCLGRIQLDPNCSLVCMIRGWTFIYILRWTNDAGEGVHSPTRNSHCHLRGQGWHHILSTPPCFLIEKEVSGPDMSSEGNLSLQLLLLSLSILSLFLNTWLSSLLAWEESSAFSGFSWVRYLWVGK